jgi:very-short-patch-repair endonuclease
MELFLQILKIQNIPIPIAEHRFHSVRRWRFDFAWLDHKLALEVEGGVWTRGRHTRSKGFIQDIEKYNEAVRLGWSVIRCVPNELVHEKTLELIRDCLGRDET